MVELLEILTGMQSAYKEKVKPHADTGKLEGDPRYQLFEMCNNLFNLSDQLIQYHHGRLLAEYSKGMWNELLDEKMPTPNALRNFETALAQTRLAVETNNR